MTIRCIDAHVHLGDVCAKYTRKYRTKYANVSSLESFLEKYDYPSLVLKLLRSDLFPKAPLLRYCAQVGLTATPENLIKSMAEAGILQSFILPIEPENSTNSILKICNKHESLVPLFSLDFNSITIKTVHSAIRSLLVTHPFVGLKFHPNIQGVDPLSEIAEAVYLEAGMRGFFIMMHVGRTPFIPGPQGRLAMLSNVFQLPSMFPKTNFIFCHMGGYFDPDSNSFYTGLKEQPNVWFDTSGVSVKSIILGLQNFGYKKVIFGSDWPYASQSVALKRTNLAVKIYSERENVDFSIALDHVLFRNAVTLMTGLPN